MRLVALLRSDYSEAFGIGRTIEQAREVAAVHEVEAIEHYLAAYPEDGTIEEHIAAEHDGCTVEEHVAAQLAEAVVVTVTIEGVEAVEVARRWLAPGREYLAVSRAFADVAGLPDPTEAVMAAKQRDLDGWAESRAEAEARHAEHARTEEQWEAELRENWERRTEPERRAKAANAIASITASFVRDGSADLDEVIAAIRAAVAAPQGDQPVAVQ